MFEGKKVGLVLGGGGAKGFAHLGVVQALVEKGASFDMISGVSAGAIAGSFLASGMKPKAIFDLLKIRNVFNYSKMMLPVEGFLQLNGLQNDIKKNIAVHNIEELPTKLFIAVANINKGCVEYLNAGNLAKAVLASSSIPILFSPVKIRNQKYVDGSLFDNLPVNPLLEKCDIIIGVGISPIREQKKLDNLIEIVSRVFQLGVNESTIRNKELCTYFIEPDGLDKFDILDTSKATELYDLGYETAKSFDFK